MQPYVQALIDYRKDPSLRTKPIEFYWDQIASSRNSSRAPADYEAVPSRGSIYEFRARYVAADCDIRALLPRYWDRGNRIARLSEDLLDIIDEAVEILYLDTIRLSKVATIAAVQAHLKELNDAVGQPDSELLEPLPKTSDKMIRRRIDRLEKYDLAHYRTDPLKAQNQHTPVGLGPVATRVNERWELDSSPLDVQVVCEKTKLKLGRPTITAVLDCASRLTVGWAITFEGESTLQVMLALRHAISPKPRGVFKTYNPGRGRPEGIWVDNGKAHKSESFKSAMTELGIQPFLLPPKRPRLRGKIERWFRSLNMGLIHNLRGTTKSNPIARGKYNSEEEAVFTLEQIQWLIGYWICNVYNARVHRGTKRSPIRLWNELAAVHPPSLPPHIDDLNVLLSRLDERKVTRSGIEWEGLLYNGWVLTDLLNRPGFDPKSLKIRINEEDVSTIYILAPGMVRYEPIPCTNQKYAEGKSVHQHKVCVAYAKELANEDRRLTENDYQIAWGKLILAGTQLFNSKVHRKLTKRLARFFKLGIKRVDVTPYVDGDEDLFDDVTEPPELEQRGLPAPTAAIPLAQSAHVAAEVNSPNPAPNRPAQGRPPRVNTKRTQQSGPGTSPDIAVQAETSQPVVIAQKLAAPPLVIAEIDDMEGNYD